MIVRTVCSFPLAKEFKKKRLHLALGYLVYALVLGVEFRYVHLFSLLSEQATVVGSFGIPLL